MILQGKALIDKLLTTCQEQLMCFTLLSYQMGTKICNLVMAQAKDKQTRKFVHEPFLGHYQRVFRIPGYYATPCKTIWTKVVVS